MTQPPEAQKPNGSPPSALTPPMPKEEPVVHVGCRTCRAAGLGRALARLQKRTVSLRAYNRIIAGHPHRSDT